MSNPIDEYVRRSLADQEIAPSRNLFADKIQPRIEQRKAAAFPFLRVAAALVLLLAGWMVIQLLNRPATGNDKLEYTPIAIEEPLEAPATNLEQSVEGDDPVTDDTPVLEKIDATKVAIENTTQKPGNNTVTEQPVVLAMAEQPENTETANPIGTAAEKPQIKVSIKIDPTKYANAAVANTEPEETQPTVLEYANEQIKNVKDGEGLQAPPKEWFDLHKLAVKVEGNPLKRILNGKE